MPSWLLFSLLTVLCWGVWGVLGKSLGEMSAVQQQAFSTLGILPIMLALAATSQWRLGVLGERRLRGSLLAFASGTMVGLGNLAYYQVLALGSKASTAAALTGMYPVGTVILGVLVLKETPRLAQVLGIGSSLAALYLLSLGHWSAADHEWLVYALAPIVLWGGASVLMKLSTADITAQRATFWFLSAFVPLGLILLALGPAFGLGETRWDLPGRDWLLVSLLGAMYGLGNLTLLAAYRNEGKVSIVTPLSGLYPIVTIPLAIMFFDEKVGMREWGGIALALAAAAVLSYEPAPAPPNDLDHATVKELNHGEVVPPSQV